MLNSFGNIDNRIVDKFDKEDSKRLYKVLSNRSLENLLGSDYVPFIRLLWSMDTSDNNYYENLKIVVVRDFEYKDACNYIMNNMSEETNGPDLSYMDSSTLSYSTDKISDTGLPDNSYFKYKFTDMQYALARDFLCVCEVASYKFIIENKNNILLADFAIRISDRLPYTHELAKVVVKFISATEARHTVSRFLEMMNKQYIPLLRDNGVYDEYRNYSITYSKCKLVIM